MSSRRLSSCTKSWSWSAHPVDSPRCSISRSAAKDFVLSLFVWRIPRNAKSGARLVPVESLVTRKLTTRLLRHFVRWSQPHGIARNNRTDRSIWAATSAGVRRETSLALPPCCPFLVTSCPCSTH
jgi:hypothetical protein